MSTYTQVGGDAFHVWEGLSKIYRTGKYEEEEKRKACMKRRRRK
jgi:hypothetical protein